MELGIQDLSDALATGSAWTTYVPTTTNITVGSGTIAAAYSRYGKTIIGRFSFTFGAGSAMGSAPTFTLPFAARATADPILARGYVFDSGTDYYDCYGLLNSTTQVAINIFSAAGAYLSRSTITATVPMVWTTNDVAALAFTYEAA
jgi:hypothetical protein